MSTTKATALLLNAGHALDHLFLLIFATAVAAIAAEWGLSWQDLMPYTAGAFVMFGLGALPAGRLGDLWGRRSMMIIFFIGLGVSAMFVAAARGPLTLAVALTIMGVFTAIYHPVGIPMIVQNAKNPGFTIGVNGLAGNLGIAFAALLTGFLVKYAGWRMAFIVPGAIAIACGALFAALAPREDMPPAKRPRKSVGLPASVMRRVFVVMTLAAVTGSLIFNFTTNGNGQLFAERFTGVVDDPATLGLLLAGIYTVASFAQIAVGKLIDRVPLKRLYPLDIDRALRSLERLGRANIVWHNTNAEPIQQLTSGAVPLANCFNGRVIAANRSGGQIGYTPAYSGVMGNPYGVISSSANKREAFEYLNYMLNTPKAAAEYMELTYYAVPNTEALKLVSPDIVNLLPTSPKLKDKVYIKDDAWWAANLARVTARFKEWQLGG